VSKKTTEIRLVAPRQVPLSAEQELEAVSLLAELLLDAAAKRRGCVLAALSTALRAARSAA